MRLQFPTTFHHHNRFKLFSSFLTFFQPSSSTWHTHNNINHNNINHNNNNNPHMDPTPILPTTTTTLSTTTTRRRKRKIIIIMGPTGAGKSRLSIDLTTQFFHNAEIINSDKMQVYSGLNITTNKITIQEQSGIPHHLLGTIDPTKTVFTPSDFRKVGSEYISDIKSRRGLPIIVGGSNSLIYSLVTKRYDPTTDVFNGPDPDPVSTELRYDCCFIWVDVCLPVLNQYLNKRVDEMLDSGMFEELVEFFGSGENNIVKKSGLGQAIGVPEFETYFDKFKDCYGGTTTVGVDNEEYEEAVRRIKDNTIQLAKKQVSKILRLRDAGWDLKRIDATEAFRAVMTSDSGGGRVAEIWEKQVVEPSMKIVKHFLDEETGFLAGQASRKAESKKVDKHAKACTENQHVFIPLAFDTFGSLAPEAICFLTRVQRVVHSNSSAPGGQGFVFGRLGFAIQKGDVAAQLVARLPSIVM